MNKTDCALLGCEQTDSKNFLFSAVALKTAEILVQIYIQTFLHSFTSKLEAEKNPTVAIKTFTAVSL